MRRRYGRYGAAPVRNRALLALLTVTLVFGACSDDGGDQGDEAEPATTAAPPVTEPATTGTVAGPTEGEVACIDLAERYVRRARTVFDTEGTPSDDLVNRVYEQLIEFDAIAGGAGCGDEYRNGVCDGLDALSAEGLLVIMALLPPNGCGG
jgi:hypothetical protein